MMRALVVYESMFGNTQAIADAVAEGLGAHLRVDAVEVGAAPTAVGDDVALLVVGGPTHAFGMSRPGTPPGCWQAGRARPGVGRDRPARMAHRRPWRIRQRGGGVRHADRPRLPRSAARAAEKRLGRLGFRIVAPAKSFYVDGTQGPLLDGELERARRWADQLGAAVTRQVLGAFGG